jgi:hypothetical protein
MSAIDLGALLADASQSGAYYVDLHDRTAIVDTATLLEFRLLPVDLRDCRDHLDALERIAAALQFPDWFGGNWDALADCLDDLSWLPAPGYVLLLDHADGWRGEDPEGFAVLLDIANDVGARRAAQRVPFWVLIPTIADVAATQG